MDKGLLNEEVDLRPERVGGRHCREKFECHRELKIFISIDVALSFNKMDVECLSKSFLTLSIFEYIFDVNLKLHSI